MVYLLAIAFLLQRVNLEQFAVVLLLQMDKTTNNFLNFFVLTCFLFMYEFEH